MIHFLYLRTVYFNLRNQNQSMLHIKIRTAKCNEKYYIRSQHELRKNNNN
jgi:hypothetical protein